MTTFDCDFALAQGDFLLAFTLQARARAVALLGPSGSGKTTVLEAIAGLRRPSRGRIEIGDRLLFSDRGVDVAASARRVGYVPQDALLFPHLTVRGNVTYAKPRTARFDLATLEEMLELGPLMARGVQGLSGGERQRVALARALYSGPDLLLLDEPLAAVDRTARARLVEALGRIRDDLRVPLLYVTHARDEAIALSEYAVVLDRGRVVAAGAPADVG
jgi:molybdate transport system ATP-binding protein